MNLFKVFIPLSLLFCCVLAGWQGNFSCILEPAAPEGSSLHYIPITSKYFTSVSINANVYIVSQVANFSLVVSLQAENGTEYFLTAYDYIKGQNQNFGFVVELSPCVVASFVESNYSVRVFYSPPKGQVNVNFEIFVDDKVIGAHPALFQTYSVSDYLKIEIPANNTENQVDIFVNSTNSAKEFPITHFCWNSHTCPSSSIDCISGASVQATNTASNTTVYSAWNTTLYGVAPGIYYLLLDTVGSNYYTIYATVKKDITPERLVLEWYYVIVIAVGCIFGTSLVVGLICWRKHYVKTHYIPIQSPTEIPASDTQYKIVVN